QLQKNDVKDVLKNIVKEKDTFLVNDFIIVKADDILLSASKIICKKRSHNNENGNLAKQFTENKRITDITNQLQALILVMNMMSESVKQQVQLQNQTALVSIIMQR